MQVDLGNKLAFGYPETVYGIFAIVVASGSVGDVGVVLQLSLAEPVGVVVSILLLACD